MTERRELFPFIDARHPLAERMTALRGAAARLRDELGGLEVETEPEIKVIRRDGGWVLNRFYCSYQWRDDAGHLTARTLYFTEKTGRTTVFDYPADPYLPGLFDLPHGEVLRYVPLRRVTMLRRDPDGSPAVIVKMKRRTRCREAHARLSAVWEASARAGHPIRLPSPIGIDHEKSLFLQEALPGDDLAATLRLDEMEEMLGAVGALHRDLHALPAEGLPLSRPGAVLAGVGDDLAWIRFAAPDLGRRLAAAARTLLATDPGRSSGPPALCHGDFVCSQVLRDGPELAVVDLDLASCGDPYRDIAIAVTSLPYDVAELRALEARDPVAAVAAAERGAASYLGGYERRSGRSLDESRLLWHRIAAEIYYVGVQLKKDRATEAGLDRAARAVDALARRLASLGRRAA